MSHENCDCPSDLCPKNSRCSSRTFTRSSSISAAAVSRLACDIAHTEIAKGPADSSWPALSKQDTPRPITDMCAPMDSLLMRFMFSPPRPMSRRTTRKRWSSSMPTSNICKSPEDLSFPSEVCTTLLSPRPWFSRLCALAARGAPEEYDDGWTFGDRQRGGKARCMKRSDASSLQPPTAVAGMATLLPPLPSLSACALFLLPVATSVHACSFSASFSSSSSLCKPSIRTFSSGASTKIASDSSGEAWAIRFSLAPGSVLLPARHCSVSLHSDAH